MYDARILIFYFLPMTISYSQKNTHRVTHYTKYDIIRIKFSSERKV